ncbi:MAG: protein translocase subunit SecD [Candidatus Taylorbacteria bacterium]|nr:protein translocase subunit SecD [Candidatus Taylorbacteria bacterium]
MIKRRFWAIILILASLLVAYFVYSTQSENSSFKFRLGLDLNGGTELVYKPDLKNSSTTPSEIQSSMSVLRDVIEKRVNMFGVSEPIVRVERIGFTGGQNEQQLVVELPGVSDIDKAVAMIGATPTLDFKLLSKDAEKLTQEEFATKKIDEIFEYTGLTGRLLKKSQLEFNQTTGEAMVALQFNKEGEDLFAKITKENVNRKLAIFLDGDLKSMPVIKEEIKGGQAVISGSFNGSAGIKEAKKLVDNLNLGALPVPIELISTQTIGASLGQDAIDASVKAGIIAFIVIALFLILWYRLPGFLAVIALAIYSVINLALFKFIPVTLTAAGIAAFILSVGMAVDANILIFERMKEELKRGRELGDAVQEGFHRAWTSIRDSNISSMITAIILFMFSSTSVVKGFALVFFIGVAVSMFTAITASRTLLLAIKHDHAGRLLKFLFGGKFNSNPNLTPKS